MEPATTHASATHTAHEILERMSRVLRDGGATLPYCGSLTIVDALASFLAPRLAEILRQKATRRDGVKQTVRRVCYDEALYMRGQMHRLLHGAYRVDRAPANPIRILIVPRRPAHMRDLVPVLQHAESTGLFSGVWLFFRTDATRAARDEGKDAYSAHAIAPFSIATRLQAHVRLEAAARRWMSELQPIVSNTERSQIVEDVLAECRIHLLTSLVAAQATQRMIERTHPRLVVAGNALTLEGKIACSVGRCMGVKTACLQHGEIGPGQLDWKHSDLDLYTVWGEAPKTLLKNHGVAEDRVAVTGAPWTDRLRIDEASRRPMATKRVVIALSGAGHAVSRDEHQRHVAAVGDAVRACPRVEWCVRVHPKDDPELFRRALGPTLPQNVTIRSGLGVPSIHDDLASSDLLVTATSAAALDAMLHGVAVMTLDLENEAALPDFVRAQATTRVHQGETLATSISRFFKGELSSETMAHARDYVRAYFGPCDGLATQRAARALHAVATQTSLASP